MTKRMLIDATHAEETRVVVLDGTRLEDFDVETSTKRQLKGNIYLAKVVRVEPSLQAAFVEYGGNRHGFLAFSEIHPDYYQIPVADRQRLIEMQAEEARREEEEEDLEMALGQASSAPDPEPFQPSEVPPGEVPPDQVPLAQPTPEPWALAAFPRMLAAAADPVAEIRPTAATRLTEPEPWAKSETPRLLAAPADVPILEANALEADVSGPNAVGANASGAIPLEIATQRVHEDDSDGDDSESYDSNGDHVENLPPPETVGGGDQETGDDQRERRMPPRFLRNYKIQEVIRRRQILLIQVVKEERGTKGAALTTYLSLAGRFGVLMPNSPRGGGISRKITSATDRRRLKEVMAELDIPRGMGMIVRTAGANRPKPEIKRDCEYLLRLWDDIREHTMKSVAPALIYEEASLIKRAIRDVYSRDIDEILVDGEEGWRAAHDFMRMLMPSHAKKVQLWRDNGQPLFARSQVEAQLDGMLMPTVQLRSGGYLVINQAEALVAIDVNSGRSTRERNVEETALRTNLEAADEVARQLRLRDLAGLIVIDFIDMESKRHNAMVERRIKEALKNDRARIQVGHISHFGLLEMSRQRLRPSLAETSFIPCPHCGGTGHVRSTENAAIHVLRGIEDEGGKRRSAEIIVHVSTPVALYLLNHKRERLREIELRYVMRVIIAADDAQIAPQFRIEKVRTRSPDELPVAMTAERSLPPPVEDVEDDDEVEADPVGAEDEDDDQDSDNQDNDSGEDTAEERAADAASGGGADEAERRKKRRRRRRRGGRRDDQQPGAATGSTEEPAEGVAEVEVRVSEDGSESAAPAAVTPTLADSPLVAGPAIAAVEAQTEPVVAEATVEATENPPAPDDDPANRRRGRRGGRRRRRDNEGELSPFAVPGADQPDLQPAYAGPTPADPFGGRAFDIFDVMDQAERAAEAKPASRTTPAMEIVNDAAPEPQAVSEPEGAPQPEAASTPEAIPEPPVPPESEVAPGPQSVGPESVEPESVEPESVGPGLRAASAESGSESVEAITAPAESQPIAPAAEAVATTQPELEISNAAAPEPAAEPLGAEASAAARPNGSAEEAPEPPQQELLKPILVGADGEAPAEKRRGWWRR